MSVTIILTEEVRGKDTDQKREEEMERKKSEANKAREREKIQAERESERINILLSLGFKCLLWVVFLIKNDNT